VFITVAIILFVAGEFFIFGVLIALWGAFALLGAPLWKAARHVLRSPTLHRRRKQAIRIASAFVIAVVIVVALVPLPLRTHAEGVIWLPDQSLLRAGGKGVFERWLVEPGTRVAQGTPIAALDDPALAAELDVARARFDEAAARYKSTQFTNLVEAAVHREQFEQAQRVFERTAERAARLIVRSEAAGTVVAPRPQDMAGQFFKQGELLGYVLDRRQFIARVIVPQADIDLVRTRLESVELRLADAIPEAYPATVIREVPGGVDELPSAALGPSGGGVIAVDPKDGNGLKTLERVFVFDLRLPPEAAPKAFGERVYVRFEHRPEPLLSQGYRRFRQLFLSRFNV
jgi:putative peptide zinc metalloprotease protein